MSKNKLNGSVKRLAHALSDVFIEAVEPVREDMKALRKEFESSNKSLRKYVESNDKSLRAKSQRTVRTA